MASCCLTALLKKAARQVDWKKAEAIEGGVKLPASWLSLHYYEGLNVLFRVENSLRVFVYTILKNNYGEEWTTLSIESDDLEKGTIDSIAKKRRNQAKKFGYLTYPVSCAIMHLTSGELNRLITADSYWKHFADFFPASKDVIRSKLEEIGVIRNAFAHFRPLREDDVEVVKQNAKQTLQFVETYLQEMLDTTNTTPTNTTDAWYLALKSVSTGSYCELEWNQSADGRWVQMVLVFRTPVLNKHLLPEFGSYWVLNLASPAILEECPEIRQVVTYLSESASGSLDDERGLHLQKQIEFMFRRTALQNSHSKIKESLQKLLDMIEEESKLIEQDHLARGNVVQVATTFARLHKNGNTGFWAVNTEELGFVVKESDRPEYWGKMNLWIRDFIAGTHKYPWMPVEVSAKESPW
jgi:hypothetical protein